MIYQGLYGYGTSQEFIILNISLARVLFLDMLNDWFLQHHALAVRTPSSKPITRGRKGRKWRAGLQATRRSHVSWCYFTTERGGIMEGFTSRQITKVGRLPWHPHSHCSLCRLAQCLSIRPGNMGLRRGRGRGQIDGREIRNSWTMSI